MLRPNFIVLLALLFLSTASCSKDPGTENSSTTTDSGADAATTYDAGPDGDDGGSTVEDTGAPPVDMTVPQDAAPPTDAADASADVGGSTDAGVGDFGTQDAGMDVGVDVGETDAGTDAMVCPDADGDGYDDASCGGMDCDDNDPATNPGAAEICGDGIDNDCDATTNDLFDADGDGYDCSVDCDDDVGSVNPGVAEVCDDGVDNDCDASTADLFDADGDGFDCSVDCDDDDSATNPGATELCNDSIDNDCDASTSDLFDTDGDGYDCSVDCDDDVASVNPGATEVCDNTIDDNCNGAVDMADATCPSMEVCDNGIDDDLDGDADCADTDCSVDPACEGDSCDNSFAVTTTNSTWVVDVTPLTDSSAGSCAAQSGNDAVFAFNLPTDSDVHVDTAGTPFDTVIYLRSGSCSGGTELVCNDNVTTLESWSRLDVHALPAGDYWLFVDANGTAMGDVTVNISITDVAPRSLVAVADDPLLRMPGTQPAAGDILEGPDRCMNCHEVKQGAPLLGKEWKGSMMAQAARDPLFWAAMTVAAQDSIWVLGNANATDLCERCHFPEGWLEDRSDPTNASLMTGSDYDGVHCDVCHKMVDPFATATAAGTREGNDWAGYWDEQNVVSPSSSDRAQATLAEDQAIFATLQLFNTDPLYDAATWLPELQGWIENGGGQMFIDPNGGDKRGPYADDSANHQTNYSRYHKSKYFCQTCHDVSNPALANLGADPNLPLPSETDPAFSYFHVERTFSEFMLSDFAQQGGAAGTGYFDPATFDTSQPGDVIASCQDCHMPNRTGVAVDKNSAKTRPTESDEHIRHGVGSHAMVGGNAWIPRILASTVNSSPNYDATNENLLNQGPSVLTLDLSQGLPLDADALLSVANEAELMLQRAATIENASYSASTGSLTFRVVNHTGHKLISGFPEGRRMFLNIVARDSGGNVLHEVNPYDYSVGTLKGLDPTHAPSSPALGPNEAHETLLVYEANPSSSITGETKTFHFVLADGRYKDNRIPPRGFDIASAPDRLSEPVINGQSAPNYFTSAEYASGYDEVSLTLPTGAASVEIRLYYQTTSREYVEFLRDQINGTATTLYSETPAGAAIAYVAQTDPFFSALAGWGDTMWQLWEHNKDLPGAAPIEMVSVTLP